MWTEEPPDYGDGGSEPASPKFFDGNHDLHHNISAFDETKISWRQLVRELSRFHDTDVIHGSDVIRCILQEDPEVARLPDQEGGLPLHIAVESEGVSDEVVEAVLAAYSDAVEHADGSGWLPLHKALVNASVSVILKLLEAYPEAARHAVLPGEKTQPVLVKLLRSDEEENLNEDSEVFHEEEYEVDCVPVIQRARGPMPLHIAIQSKNAGASDEVVGALLAAYSDAAKHADSKGWLPLHEVLINFPTSASAILKILAAYPEAARHALPEREEDMHKIYKLVLSDKKQEEKARLRQNSCTTPLHLAVGRSPLEVVEALIKACPASAFDDDETVLSSAFIQHVQDPPNWTRPARPEFTYRTLHRAPKPELPQVPKLIGSGAHTMAGARDKDGKTPLHLAVDRNRKIFPTQSKQLDWRSGTIQATELASLEVVEALIKANPDCAGVLDGDGKTPLRLAVESRADADIVKALLRALASCCARAGAMLMASAPQSIRENGLPDTVLHGSLEWKIWEQSQDFVRLLHGALQGALQGSDPAGIEIVRVLLEAHPEGRTWTNDGGVPCAARTLEVALQGTCASIEVLKGLMERLPSYWATLSQEWDGYDFDIDDASDPYLVDVWGMTPLHWAVLGEPASADVVKLLIEYQREPVTGKIPPQKLLWAARQEHTNGATALHVAMEETIASLAAVELLQQEYPDAVKRKDEQGCYPLHKALGLGVKFRCSEPRDRRTAIAERKTRRAIVERKRRDLGKMNGPTANDCAVVEALVKWFPEAVSEDIQGQYPLTCAVQLGFPVSTVRKLIKACALHKCARFQLSAGFKYLDTNTIVPELWPAFAGVVDTEGRNVLLEIFHDPACREAVLDALVRDAHSGADETLHSWSELVSNDDHLELVSAVLQHPEADAWHLVFHARDVLGRSAVDVATEQCRQALDEQVLFCGRYKFLHATPNYVSDTCEIWFATGRAASSLPDSQGQHDSKQEASTKVCIKLLRNEAECQKELDARSKFELDPEHVVAVLHSQSLEGQQRRLPDASLFKLGSAAGFCVVMECGSLNFGEMLKNQRLAGDYDRVLAPLKDIANCLEHLHAQGLVHCDVKPQNVVQIGGRVKGIDLDGSAEAGSGYFGGKVSTAYLPPECVIKRADGSYRAATEVDELAAAPSMDVWQFGVLLYHAMAGQELFHPDVCDNLARDKDWRELAQWTDHSKKARLRVVKHDSARELLDKLLMKDPTRRPQTMADVLDSAFFRSDNLQHLEAKVDQILGHTAEIRSRTSELKQLTMELSNLASRTLDQVKRSESVLRKAVFEASEITIPTCFVILPCKISLHGKSMRHAGLREMQEHLEGIAAVGKEVGSAHLQSVGGFVETESDSDGSLLSELEAGEDREGLVSKESRGEGVRARIESWLSSKLYDPDQCMYLYLIDECTGHPALEEEGCVYPIEIRTPRDTVQKLLPLLYLSISAVSLASGGAGLARMFGYPIPMIPKSMTNKARRLVGELAKENSAQQFSCLQSCVAAAKDEETQGGGEKLGGAALREFERFLQEGDSERTFGGLQRVMAQDGTVFWTSKHNARLIEDGLFPAAQGEGAEGAEDLSGRVQELERKLQAAEESLRESMRREGEGDGGAGLLQARTQAAEFAVIKLGRGLSPKLRRKLLVVGAGQTAQLINQDLCGRTRKAFDVSQLVGLSAVSSSTGRPSPEAEDTTDLRITFRAESKQKDYQVKFESADHRALFCSLLLSHSSSLACDPALHSDSRPCPARGS